MWDGETGTASDLGEKYRPAPRIYKDGGFFQPFSDGPINNPENPAEDMYCSIITGAQEYVYITSPYLIIDSAMVGALSTAAGSGVDVRIITPKIGDLWFVHAVTRSNYTTLLRAGVRIFEYTPGFIHAKTILSDNDHAITGSINMDYRSFNLQFENGVYICGDPVLLDIKVDMDATLAMCEEILLEQWLHRPFPLRFVENILRLFAVLF